MIRPATPQDAPAIEAFLALHAESSMFLRSALAAYGPCGGADPTAARFWLEDRQGSPGGVFALNGQGIGLIQAPDPGFDWAALATLLAGEFLTGMNGVPDQIARARAAFGLAATPVDLDRTEPLYVLALENLTVPEAATLLRATKKADTARIAGWRAAYLAEIMGARPGSATDALARQQARRMAGAPHVRLLMRAGDPVAMTAFNAVLPGIVQVGSVYTPPAERAQGHARRAVALHLAQARDAGVARAVLFAASAAAARAYEAIGFRQTGRYHLLDFGAARVIGGAAWA